MKTIKVDKVILYYMDRLWSKEVNVINDKQ